MTAVSAVTTVRRWSTPKWEVRMCRSSWGTWPTRTVIPMWTRQSRSVITRKGQLRQFSIVGKRVRLNEVSKIWGTYHKRGSVRIIGMGGVRRLRPVLSEVHVVRSCQLSNTRKGRGRDGGRRRYGRGIERSELRFYIRLFHRWLRLQLLGWCVRLARRRWGALRGL